MNTLKTSDITDTMCNERMTIENNNVYLDGKTFDIETEYYDTYYNKRFETMSLLVNDSKLIMLLQYIDSIILKSRPENDKSIHKKMLKESKNNTYVNIKYKYANIFDKERNSDNIKNFTDKLKGGQFQSRCILSISKVKEYNGNVGVSVLCKQLQYKPKECHKYDICMFE